MAWWSIEDVEFRAALERVATGEDPGMVEAELYANSEVVQVEPE
jgi:hypothetical protein